MTSRARFDLCLECGVAAYSVDDELCVRCGYSRRVPSLPALIVWLLILGVLSVPAVVMVGVLS